MDVEGLEHPDKWAVETFGTAELGDLRRTDRLVRMATVIAENPSASLPESMRNWADTLAAYRFLDNPNISHEQIMLPHWIQTREEAMRHSRDEEVGVFTRDRSLADLEAMLRDALGRIDGWTETDLDKSSGPYPDWQRYQSRDEVYRTRLPKR